MGKFKLQLFAKSIEDLAKEVIKGNYGNGDARKQALGSQYGEVQKVVNQMLNGSYKPASTNTNKNANNTQKANNTPAANNKNVPKVNGVDSSLMETINSTYAPSNDVKKLEGNLTDSGNAYKDWASNTNIIDQSTLDALNKKWEVPTAVLEADKLLSAQLEQIRSGRTSYTDKVEELFNKYMNREDFEYDVSEDQLFQQALASAMGSGKAAMQDTIGQASALTGGYGSTYATSAGNQAYNSFIEDAYNNLPEYYNMALQAYQMEGDEMLQQFNMAATLDAQEYGRLVDSYNAGVEDRNWQYNTAFNEYTTGVTNAYNSANLQLQQNAQVGNNLYNTYLVEKDAYETKYKQEYQTWLDGVNSAVNIAGMQNKDYWSQTELDYRKERDKVADYQWQKEYNLKSASSGGSGGSGGKLSGVGLSSAQEQTALDKLNTKGPEAAITYIEGLGKAAGWSEDQIDAVANAITAGGQTIDPTKQAFTNWEAVDKGGLHIGKVDDNAIVKDVVTGKTYTGTQLYNYFIAQGLSKKDAREETNKIQKQAGVK
jgi:hypothetical protein